MELTNLDLDLLTDSLELPTITYFSQTGSEETLINGEDTATTYFDVMPALLIDPPTIITIYTGDSYEEPLGDTNIGIQNTDIDVDLNELDEFVEFDYDTWTFLKEPGFGVEGVYYI